MTLQVHACESGPGHVTSFGQRMRWKRQCAISEPRPSDILQGLPLYSVPLPLPWSRHTHVGPWFQEKEKRLVKSQTTAAKPSQNQPNPGWPRCVSHEYDFKPLRFGLVYYVAKVDSSFLCVIPALVPYSLRHKVQAKPSSVWTQLLLLSWCLQISLFTLLFSNDPRWLAVLQMLDAGPHFYASAPDVPSAWNAILLSFAQKTPIHLSEPSSGIIFSKKTHYILFSPVISHSHFCERSGLIYMSIVTMWHGTMMRVLLMVFLSIFAWGRGQPLFISVSLVPREVPGSSNVWWLNEVLGSFLAGGFALNGKMIISCFLSSP